jgi:hypothetical protein
MRSLIPVMTVGFLLSASAWTKPKHWHEDDRHWNKHSHQGDDDDRDFDHRRDGCYFQPRDVRVISEYYAPQYRNLPPGLQKKLYRTGRLPPGWEKKMTPLPVIVERQMVPVPVDYRRGVIDGYAVIYNPRTQVVIDITAVFGSR